MRHKLGLLLGLVVVAIAAGGAAPWRSLPPYLLGKWEGITATDPTGQIVGPEDASDWGCLAGGTSIRPADDPVPAPLPNKTCLKPAVPNPTSGRTTLYFSLVSASQVSLVIYGKKGNGPHGAFRVRTLVSQELPPGLHSVSWDGNDDDGIPLSKGIYRAVLVVGDQGLWGDIEIQ